MADLSIDLTANQDTIAEGPERLRIDLSNPMSATGLTASVSATSGSVTTTINDDDTVIWSLTGSTNVNEGDDITYTLSTVGTPDIGETVNVDLELTDVDTNSSDYEDFVTAVEDAISMLSLIHI